MNDPKVEYRKESNDQEWAAFLAQCEDRYDFHPDRDGPVTAAENLGQQDGNWGTVWRRFAEAPAAYPMIPEQLRKAKPEKTLPLLYHAESWPQDNEEAERALREALVQLSSLDPSAARRAILDLERDHRHRRSWVWVSLGLRSHGQGYRTSGDDGEGHRYCGRVGSTVLEAVNRYAGDRMGCRPRGLGCARGSWRRWRIWGRCGRR